MTTSRDRPNIVFILADDMGYGDFSAFNGGLSRTPTLDALIDESVCLTQHYTSSCVCNPSRATLLTGRYPHRTGSIDTLEWWGLERLALRETTLADVLQGMGYATGLVGKWHLGAFDPRYHPNVRGFEEAVCFRGGMHDYYNWRIEYNDRVERADGRYLTDVWTDEAVAFIGRHRHEPFFLHVTYNAPHTPLEAPLDEIRPFQDKGQFTQAVSILYGMIHRMDTGVARILEALQEYGLEGNTILCFTSDNGPQFGGQGERSTTRFNCQFHGAKGSTYEGGIRVPMLIRWPAGLEGGRTCHEMVHFADWFPTLLAATGGEVPQERTIDGVNVLPVLRREGGQVETCRFWQWNRYRPDVTGNAAMRDGDWKLVRPAIREAMHVPDIYWLWVSMYGPEYFIDNGVFQQPYPARQVPPPPPPELYNVAEDPLEQRNLAAQYPERARKMLRELETWFEEVEAERATIDDEW
jgi:arylsulfatase A-like enzyme